MARPKVSVIGAGQVGQMVAEHIAIKELADVYLFDVVDGAAKGKSLDIMEGLPHWHSDSFLEGYTIGPNGENYENLKNSDVIVITAGMARKPGMSRDDLLFKNVDIVKSAAENVKKYSPNSIIIVVTNPMDIMTYTAFRIINPNPKRIFGMGGTLDSGRFMTFVAKELGVSVEDVQAFVVGGHGDDMVPFVRYCSVGGIPITELLPKEKIDQIVARTRNGGGEIVQYLKTGSAYFAPGISTTIMVESVIKDKKRVITVPAYLSGEIGKHYGVEGFFVGVPVKIGKEGVEEIYKLNFTPEERKLWDISASHVKENVEKVNKYLNL
jgi:malate dehydrogenase (NAD) (EC 1.1.1.37)